MNIVVRHFRGAKYLGKFEAPPAGSWLDIQAAATAAGHPLAKGDLVTCVGGAHGHPFHETFYGVVRIRKHGDRKDGFPIVEKLEVD